MSQLTGPHLRGRSAQPEMEMKVLLYSFFPSEFLF